MEQELEALLRLGCALDCTVKLGDESVGVRMAEKLLRIRARDGRLVPLRANAAQRAFEAARGQHNVVLKARQMGMTTWLAGRMLLRTITARGVMTVLVAQNREAAEAIFRVVGRMWENLPTAWREGPLRRSRANVGQMVFAALDSEFRVVSAADENAGRGITIQNLLCSEVSRWPGDAAATLAGLRAALVTGGESVLESTPNGAYGAFYSEWLRGVDSVPTSQRRDVGHPGLRGVDSVPTSQRRDVGHPGLRGAEEIPTSQGRDVGHPGLRGVEEIPTSQRRDVGHPGLRGVEEIPTSQRRDVGHPGLRGVEEIPTSQRRDVGHPGLRGVEEIPTSERRDVGHPGLRGVDSVPTSQRRDVGHPGLRGVEEIPTSQRRDVGHPGLWGVDSVPTSQRRDVGHPGKQIPFGNDNRCAAPAQLRAVRHFLPWWLEPAYVAAPVSASEWSAEEHGLVAAHGLSAEQVGFRRELAARYGALRSQEFAEDAETCFRATGSCCFDVESIERQMAFVREPLEVRRAGALRVWWPAVRGREYIVAVDPAGGGSEGDFAAVQVVDRVTGVQCAELQERVEPLRLASAVRALAMEYGGATVVVERNNHGGALLAYLQTTAPYERVWCDRDGQRGWLTTSSSKREAVSGLGGLLASRAELFQSRELLRECRSFVTREDGRSGAANGAHDDLLMAMAIAQAVRLRG